MKILKLDTGFRAFQKLFQYLVSNSSDIVAWQTLFNEKKVCKVQMTSFNPEAQTLHFNLLEEESFDPAFAFYFYAEAGQLIFKSEAIAFKPKSFSIFYPQEIHLIGEEEVVKIHQQLGERISTVWRGRILNLEQFDTFAAIKVKAMSERTARDQTFLNNEFNPMSVDEEDKLYADKRSSPRARPKVEKWVKIRLKDSSEVHFLKLFDLSRGGLSFVTVRAEVFPKGAAVYVVGFEEHDLDDPIQGTIMSQRPLDESQADLKIGIKFDEGQG